MTQLFLSTVTAEFKSYRDALRHDFDRPNVTVKVQEDFIVSGTPTLEKLDDYIRQCDGVIHLVGGMTGALAKQKSVDVILERYPDLIKKLPIGDFLASNGPSLSYTQWEAWLALLHDKKLFIAVPAEGAPRDPDYATTPQQEESQLKHLALLKQIEFYPGEPFRSRDHLAKEVLRSFILDLLSHSGTVRQRAVPELLPYLPNRDEQEMEVIKAMNELLGHRNHRTLMAIVHGNEDESHQTFLPRLLKYHLPGRLRSTECMMEFSLPWPRAIPPGPDFPHRFQEWLQQKLLQESPSTANRLEAFFQQQPGPVILTSTLYTDDWVDQGLPILEALRSFWNDPHNLPNCNVVHWVTIRYQAVPPPGSFSLFPLNIIHLWRLLSRLFTNSPNKGLKHRNRINQQIRSHLKKLSVTESDRLQTIVLPELQAVCHSDADNWVASQPVRTFLRNNHILKLSQQVGEIFDRHEAERQQAGISLEPLGHKLHDLLQRLAPAE
jgi:hypothetical protein